MGVPSGEHRPGAGHPDHPAHPLTRWLAIAVIAIVVGMVPWTAYLAWTLPRHFDAHNWRLAWVGFDSALIAALTFVAWAAWARRQVLAPTAIVVATLLTCDAWFDVNTSFHTPGQALTILTALLANLPAAAFFALLARRIMLRTAAGLAAHRPGDAAPLRVRDIDLLLGAQLWGSPDAAGDPPGTDGPGGEEPGAPAPRRP